MKYRVDVDAVTTVATTLSAAADSGPSGALPTVDGCGSHQVASALASGGTELAATWRAAAKGSQGLATGLVQAADEYLLTELDVARGARMAGK